MYIHGDHPEAPLRALLLGASIIMNVEHVTCAEALRRAAEVEESPQTAIDAAKTLLEDVLNTNMHTCSSTLEDLRGQSARAMLRHAIDNQGVTFCKSIERE